MRQLIYVGYPSKRRVRRLQSSGQRIQASNRHSLAPPSPQKVRRVCTMLQRAALQLPSIARVLLPCASQGLSALQAAAYSSRIQQQQHSWSSKTAWAGAAAAFATTAAVSGQNTAYADAAPQATIAAPADPYALPAATGHIPKSITVYQYEVCPFCCKVKTFLDYHKMPYSTVEVNPLTKGELSWSSYRKVPVVKLDGEVVADSSAIISRLQAELDAAQQGGSSGGKGGWLRGKQSSSSSSRADEEQWRKWVDERFVKVLTANIYRTWDESWSTTSYMAEQSSWNWGVRQGVRVAGALLMWQIGQRMPKKYNIEGDLREALYADANEFIAAVGSKPFMGGDKPNLADLAMFGVLSAIRGTDTYNDLVLSSKIGQWLSRMAQTVGPSAEVKHE